MTRDGRARHLASGWMVAGLLLGIVAQDVVGQDARTALRDGIAAYEDELDFERARPLLQRGLDPAGPQDSLWALGAQYLIDVLVTDDESLARLWGRWVMEVDPDLALAEQYVPSSVIDLLEAARAAARLAVDPAVQTSWEWSAEVGGAAPGAIAVQAAPAVRAAVLGYAALIPGERLAVPAGVYVVQAEAAGYRSVAVERAVLPGAVTVVSVALDAAPMVAEVPADVAPVVPDSLLVAQDTVPPEDPAPATVRTRKKKGFPVLLVVGGVVAAAGGAVAFLLSGGGETCSDGSAPPCTTTTTTDVPITITIPE